MSNKSSEAPAQAAEAIDESDRTAAERRAYNKRRREKRLAQALAAHLAARKILEEQLSSWSGM